MVEKSAPAPTSTNRKFVLTILLEAAFTGVVYIISVILLGVNLSELSELAKFGYVLALAVTSGIFAFLHHRLLSKP